MLARAISILHHCAPQHATQGCVSTPMTAFKTHIRRCETSPDFAPDTELAASEPSALWPRGPWQAILPSLKSHSQITASVTPATHSKRPYRNRPGRENCADSRLNHRGGPDRDLSFIGTDPAGPRGFFLPIEVRTLPGPQRRGTGATRRCASWPPPNAPDARTPWPQKSGNPRAKPFTATLQHY
jgi:hypothetical protein